MKKIFFLISIIIIIIIISMKVNYNAHINLAFGNNIICNYNYAYQNTRVIDIINDIEDNIKINDRYIQNILVQSETIYIDLNELDIDKNNVILISKLLAIIRDYSKEKIVVILKNGDEDNAQLVNNWIFQIKDKYGIMIKR